MWMSSRRTRECSYSSYDYFSFPTKERLAAMRGTAHGRHTDSQCAPLRHKAPGSLSQASNRQESLSPGSASRRVVPWGDVSSWSRSSMNLHSARPDIPHTSLTTGETGTRPLIKTFGVTPFRLNLQIYFPLRRSLRRGRLFVPG